MSTSVCWELTCDGLVSGPGEALFAFYNFLKYNLENKCIFKNKIYFDFLIW